jgi:hypothetical protein
MPIANPQSLQMIRWICSSRLAVRRLDGDLAAANSRSVSISVDGVAEV